MKICLSARHSRYKHCEGKSMCQFNLGLKCKASCETHYVKMDYKLLNTRYNAK